MLAGLLAVSDPIKSNTLEALASLKATGMRIIMASGDGLTTAKSVGAKLLIEEVYGEVTPAAKFALVDRSQLEGRTVAMAGDVSTTHRRLRKRMWELPWARTRM